MRYVTKYVWPNNGLCSIVHLYKNKRICYQCGTKRYITNISKNVWQCMACAIGGIIDASK